MDWYLGVLRKYADFSGRAHRTEYWMFILFNILVTGAVGLVDALLGLTTEVGVGLLSGVYWLAILLPALAAGARRLHDTGRSGWWQLLFFVPIIGPVTLLIFFVLDSQPGPNEFGVNPKGVR